jgi:dienelactone hydrolase
MAVGTLAPTAVTIPIDGEHLSADLTIPASAIGLVIFAHGSGSGRHSPRNQFVARTLQERRLATLLADLLTMPEEREDQYTRRWRFDIPLLGRRVDALIDWARADARLASLFIGVFGASTGAAAALIAAADRPKFVRAVVSRGGRPDLAGPALPLVEAPTLMLVGGFDEPVIELNREAIAKMTCPVRLEIVPGATHLFEEPGTLEQVAGRAADWFAFHLSDHPSGQAWPEQPGGRPDLRLA